MSKIGKGLIKSAKQVRDYARGETGGGFVVHVPDEVDVKALRKRLGYSQSQFSRRFGLLNRRGAGLGTASQDARPYRENLAEGD